MTDNRCALFYSPAFQGHDTGSHPENPGRARALERAFARRGIVRDRPSHPFSPASDEALLRVHTREHLDRLNRITGHGGAWIDSDTMVDTDSVDVARLAAGAAIAAVDAIVDRSCDRAFALGRPPGHHATPNRAMGFCLMNSIAIAAAHALSCGLERVAIVDWDVHHGNGTQDAFYGRSEVFFCSLHQSPFYPGTGRADERGTGNGFGSTLNIPLPANSGDEVYLDMIERLVIPAVRSASPDLILISAGYDAHARDPLGGMAVSTEGFRAMAEHIVALADDCCDGRIVVVLEGGYDPEALAESVLATIDALDGHAESGPSDAN